MYLKKLYFSFSFLTIIVGCQSANIERDWAMRNHKTVCGSYGFTPESDAMKMCIYNEDKRYQDQKAKQNQMIVDLISEALVPSPTYQQALPTYTPGRITPSM